MGTPPPGLTGSYDITGSTRKVNGLDPGTGAVVGTGCWKHQ